ILFIKVNTVSTSGPGNGAVPIQELKALSTSSPSNNSIVVSWAAVPHAVQYTLSVHKFQSATKMEHNTSDTSFTISGLEAGALYFIKGYAWDAEGREGENSVYRNQTTRKEKLIYSVILSPKIKNFYVSSDQSLTCNTTSSSSCKLSAVGCGEVHTIQVTASNRAGPSYPSSPSLALVETSEENCTLTWDTMPHAESYVAFIKAGDGSEMSCNTTNSNCTYHCQCGFMYLMSVLAFNPAGSSPQGEVLNHTTLPCCPEDVSVSAVSTDTLEITWAASRGAELYETSAADSSEVVLCNDTAPVCALSDLSCDSTYSVKVTPCNEFSGCNRACRAHTKDTAPCMPTNLMLNVKNSSCVSVSWTSTNRAATYSVSADAGDVKHTYTTSEESLELTDLPCGSTYEVSVTALTAAGHSLPSYSDSIETEPCCPGNLAVHQVTQAMTNVSWSHAKGAHSFIVSLTSPRGHARCHTQDSHCLMGCITCGTSYTVTMEAFSHSGRMTVCTEQGFSSSACCPSGVKLLRMADNSLRAYWRSTGSGHSTITEMVGSSNNYTCTASPGNNQCNIDNIQCGTVYHVMVAPLTADGSKVQYCGQRLYSGMVLIYMSHF
uniref:Fibronectin type-III domain-containing protein n=1 Tax=Salarias fasciatus TaxID=181472 RepID=A0A672I4J7_SALFA